jgi:NADPH:quinone reductase-like Zn-dependent oxidoreductase
LITELGRPPTVGEAPDLGDEALEVVAAPLNPVDRSVAAGQFYGGHPPLPYVPGCECVGREAGGRIVWTFGGGLGLARNGAMAERVEPGAIVAELPQGVDLALASALGIAGLAGWMPLAWRAPVQAGDRVLVLGATGTAGQVAVQAAKLLGATAVLAGLLLIHHPARPGSQAATAESVAETDPSVQHRARQ